MDLPQRKSNASANRLTVLGAVLCLWLCLWLTMLGCDASAPDPKSPRFASYYGQLPRLKHTSNLKLRAERLSLEEQSQLPASLQSEAPPFVEVVKEQSRVKDGASATTAVAKLARLFTLNKAKQLSEDAPDLFPKHYPPWPDELRLLSEKRIHNEDARVAFAEICRLDRWQFGHQFTEGLFADTSYVNFMRAGAYLELLHATEMLRRERLDEAIKSVESALLASRRLASVGHPTPRFAAADLHERSIWVMQALVSHPQRTRKQLVACLKLVHQQLDHWPPEENVWIGERADGLHTYELVRAGFVLSVLKKSELERIDRDIGLDNFEVAIRRNVDADQLFYMQASAMIIESSRRPYWERLELFEELATAMARLRKTEDHPLIADWVLLSHVQMGQRACALDQARFHAMALALADVLAVSPRKVGPNPLTGKPYRSDHDGRSIRVFDVGPPADDEPVVIPRMAAVDRQVQ